MYIAVIAGYIISAVLAFCGLCSVVSYFQGGLEGPSTGNFAYGFAIALWPLVAAAFLFALVQIAILLEKLTIYSTMKYPEMEKTSNKVHKKEREHNIPPMPGSFFHIEPSSVPPPPLPHDLPSDDMELDSIAELAHKTDSERILSGAAPAMQASYPNDAPMEPLQGEDVSLTPQPTENEKKPEDNGLSFFRIE